MGPGGNRSLGIRGGSEAELLVRVACLTAAAADDLIRKDHCWGHLARDAAGDPAFDFRTVATLLKGGLLEQLGQRDRRGRVLRVRTSTYGRRELARQARS